MKKKESRSVDENRLDDTVRRTSFAKTALGAGLLATFLSLFGSVNAVARHEHSPTFEPAKPVSLLYQELPFAVVYDLQKLSCFSGKSMDQIVDAEHRLLPEARFLLLYNNFTAADEARLRNSDVPSRGISSASESSDDETIQVIPHIVSNDFWDTLLETMNKDSRDQTYSYVARDAQGAIVGEEEVLIPANGVHRTTVEEMFPHTFEDIKRIEITADAYLNGKLYTAETFKFVSGGEEAGLMFGLSEPRARLSLPHVADNLSWWTGIGVSNISQNPVNVFLRDNTGTWTVFKEGLFPNQQYGVLLQDLLNRPISSGDLYAFSDDAYLDEDTNEIVGGQLVNALSAAATYGGRYNPDYPAARYGFSEGYVLRGEIVSADGSEFIAHNFASEHYITLDQVTNMLHLYRNTDDWDGFAYRNVSSEDQRLRIRQFDIGGNIRRLSDGLEEAIVDVVSGDCFSIEPDVLGFNTLFSSTLVLDVVDASGNVIPDAMGDVIYLNGDEPEDHSAPRLTNNNDIQLRSMVSVDTGDTLSDVSLHSKDASLSDEDAMVYLNRGRSLLGGGDVASNLTQSRYLRAPVTVDADRSALVTVFNPTDEDVTFSFAAANEAGVGQTLASALNNITLAPRAMYQVDLSIAFPTNIPPIAARTGPSTIGLKNIFAILFFIRS